MKATTTKPFTTISYNSVDFLKRKLDKDIENNIICFYIFIQHKKEDEEEKDHIHIFIEPCSKINLNSYKKTFEEIDINKPNSKPLGVMPFRDTKLYDWYYYGLHDIEYLKIKGLTRKYHYSKNNMITNDLPYMEELINEQARPLTLVAKTIKAIDNQENAIIQGLQEAKNYKEIQFTIQGVNIVRNLLKQQGLLIEEPNKQLEEDKEKASTTCDSQGDSQKTIYETNQENIDIKSNIQEDFSKYLREKQEKEAFEIYCEEKRKKEEQQTQSTEEKRKEEEQKIQSTLFYEELFKKKEN